MKKKSDHANSLTFKPSNLKTLKPYCLTIAASDTSGGAGIQRDLKTFHDIGVNGLSVITGITAQTNQKVFYAKALPVEDVENQIKIILENYEISAVKIGVVFNQEIMECISLYLKKYNQKNIVIDPVLKASDEYSFLNVESFSFMKDKFLRIADIITPNVPELETLSSMSISRADEIIEAGKLLSKKYDANIFAKGGHLNDDGDIKDYLIKGNNTDLFSAPNKHLSDVHGTGCLISSAITAYLALGFDIKNAIVKAKEYFYSIMDSDNC